MLAASASPSLSDDENDLARGAGANGADESKAGSGVAPATTRGPEGRALLNSFLEVDDSPALYEDESDDGMGNAYLSEEDLQEDCDEHGKLAYLQRCEELRIVPVSQILKYLEQDEVQVTHYGLGYRGAAALAEGLRLNRCVRTLRLGDNAIGAEGVEALAAALCESSTVEELDLSENRVGIGGCRALERMLQPTSSCVLSTLHLRGNKLGDSEAAMLAAAAATNRSLTYLDLSYNAFGEKAGTVLGDMLEANAELLELNLGWNSLRAKGTAALMEGLKRNAKVSARSRASIRALHARSRMREDACKSGVHPGLAWLTCISYALTHSQLATLDLGWNGIGDGGGVAVADAMSVNATLAELVISCNGISESVFALAEAIKKNEGLAYIELDQNNLGRKGGMAIVEMVDTNKVRPRGSKLLDRQRTCTRAPSRARDQAICADTRGCRSLGTVY